MASDDARRSESPLLDMREAAAYINVPYETLRYWRANGLGPSGFRLGRRVMFRRTTLDEFIKVTEERATSAGCAS